MHHYNDAQLVDYFDHIGLPLKNVNIRAPGLDELKLLAALQRHHMARVPFESLSLHYSESRLLSLEPEDLYTKIVELGRGGYCMEVNTFFATVLRSLGYTLFSAGGRVKGPSGYTGWDHMVNIVSVGGNRYLVDVGFGSNGPTQPVPLEDGYEFGGIAPTRGRVQYRRLEEHSDASQRVWVYSVQENESAAWKDMYHFVDTEFLPGDFEVMNLRTMTTPQSFFVQSVMCMWTLLDERKERAVGLLILHRDYVKRRMGDKSEILEQLETEEQRVRALQTHFGISLTSKEVKAIQGLASELRPKGVHV